MAGKRGGGNVAGESVFQRAGHGANQDDAEGIAVVLGKEPSPDLVVMFAEECRRRLAELGDESLCQVAALTLEGYTTQEIADKLGCVRRSVERKLERIRNKWSNAAPD